MTVSTTKVRSRWWLAPLTMLILGMALTAAAAVGAGHDARWIFVSGTAFTLLASGGFVAVGRTKGDLGAIFTSATDERQRGIDLRATAAAGVTLVVVLIVGSIVTLAQGRSGQPWIDLAAAYGVAYLIFLFIVRASRG